MTDAAFFTVTYVEAIPSAAREAASALAHNDGALREEPGVVALEVLERSERPGQFAVLAAWTSQEAFVAHTASASLARLNAELTPLLAAPMDTREHEPLALGISGQPNAGAIWVVTHVDVVPTYKDDGAAALSTLAIHSRAHDGNIRFDVWRQTNRPNHFTVVETWSTPASRDAHVGATDSKAFRLKLAAMTGALYDERLYAR